METKNESKSSKSKSSIVSTSPIRVKRETKKTITNLLAKINRKDFGRSARSDDLIALALSFIGEAEVKRLQEGTLSNADRFDRQYLDYCKKNGNLSKDRFLGILLAQEAPNKQVETGQLDLAIPAF